MEVAVADVVDVQAADLQEEVAEIVQDAEFMAEEDADAGVTNSSVKKS